MTDDIPRACRAGTCGHNVCPGCGSAHSVPAGYAKCSSCTFGYDSVEGRTSRAWSIHSGNTAEQSMAAESAAVEERRKRLYGADPMTTAREPRQVDKRLCGDGFDAEPFFLEAHGKHWTVLKDNAALVCLDLAKGTAQLNPKAHDAITEWLGIEPPAHAIAARAADLRAWAGDPVWSRACEECEGRGSIGVHACEECDGSGQWTYPVPDLTRVGNLAGVHVDLQRLARLLSAVDGPCRAWMQPTPKGHAVLVRGDGWLIVLMAIVAAPSTTFAATAAEQAP